MNFLGLFQNHRYKGIETGRRWLNMLRQAELSDSEQSIRLSPDGMIHPGRIKMLRSTHEIRKHRVLRDRGGLSTRSSPMIACGSEEDSAHHPRIIVYCTAHIRAKPDHFPQTRHLIYA